MTAQETSLRQKHLDRTRQSILSAAYELFEERGFSATTVDDIAARADVAPRTFFRYFPTKESVLFPNTAAKLQLVREALAERPAEEPIAESLIAVMFGLAESTIDKHQMELIHRIASKNANVLKGQRREMLEEFCDGLADVVSERTGIPANDVELQAMLTSLMACISSAIQCWLDNGTKGSPRTYLDKGFAACRAVFSVTPPK